MEKTVEDLRKKIRGTLLRDEPLSKHSSFGIGGNADLFCKPVDEEDVRRILAFIRENEMNLKVIGNGTNILFRDGGYRGMVLEIPFRHWSIQKDVVTAGSATPLAALITRTVQQGFGGLEPMSGIPGTVGGAVVTNAGTVAGDASQSFLSLCALDLDGNPITLERGDVQFAYRRATFPKPLLIVDVAFELVRRDPKECEAIVQDLLRRRKETQPTQAKNVGCVFKNPNGKPAGMIIDEMGLKGTRCGNAEISRVHGNFIVNHRGATAHDVMELVQLVQDRVQQEQGIQLELEIEVVGEEL
jgi:UDP-N-acetylmuramate dehydrogenase